MGPNHETNCTGEAVVLVLMKRLRDVTEWADFVGNCGGLWTGTLREERGRTR